MVAVGLAAVLPARRPWGTTARRWAGAGFVVLAIVVLAAPPCRPGACRRPNPSKPSTISSAHPGRIFTEYAWGDYSIARHRATFVDGRTDLFEGAVLTQFFAVNDLTTNPDPILSGVPRALRRVGARTRRCRVYLPHDPRWPWSTALPSPWSSFRHLQGPSRGLEAAEVAVLVGPRLDPVESQLVEEGVAASVGLVAPELEQHRSAGPQEPGCGGEDAAQHVGPVAATVVVRRVLEFEGVPREECPSAAVGT